MAGVQIVALKPVYCARLSSARVKRTQGLMDLSMHNSTQLNLCFKRIGVSGPFGQQQTASRLLRICTRPLPGVRLLYCTRVGIYPLGLHAVLSRNTPHKFDCLSAHPTIVSVQFQRLTTAHDHVHHSGDSGNARSSRSRRNNNPSVKSCCDAFFDRPSGNIFYIRPGLSRLWSTGHVLYA